MCDYNERRMANGKLKAEQIRATGAAVVVTLYHDCVDQVSQLNVSFKMGIQVKALGDLVAEAFVMQAN